MNYNGKILTFEHTEVMNFPGAIRGMRNPLDSWDKSDSGWGCYDGDSPICHEEQKYPCPVPQFILGPNDEDLALRLIRGGSEHRKFLRQIFISVDITAPRYWWQEFDTYKIGTTANSCSTMHKLKDYPFTMNMFAIDKPLSDEDDRWWHHTLNYLEFLRQEYNRTKRLAVFRKMKQALPESFLQKRTVTSDYEVVLNQLRQRGGHRLLEWFEDYVGWTQELPYIPTFAGAYTKKE